MKSRNACASEIVQSQILENEIYALLGKPKTDVIIHEWSTNVLRATMRENIPIWRRLRRKEKSRKLCTLGVHGMKMTAMRDQIKPCHLLHLQSSLISKRIIPLQIGFHFGIILVGCIYVRKIYMTPVHSSGASLQSRKEDVTLVEETNQARSKARTSRNAFEVLRSQVTSQHNASWSS